MSNTPQFEHPPEPIPDNCCKEAPDSGLSLPPRTDFGSPVSTPFARELLESVYSVLNATGSWNGRVRLFPGGISKDGKTKRSLSMPDASKVSRSISIGLGTNLAEVILTKITHQEDESYCFYFEATNESGESSSSIQVAWKENGTWNFESSLTYELRNSVYRVLNETGSWSGRVQLFPEGVSKYGQTQAGLLMPDGSKVGRRIGIGLGQDLVEATLTRLTCQEDGSYRFHFEATNESGKSSSSTQVARKENGTWNFESALMYELRSIVYRALNETGSWSGSMQLFPEGVNKYGRTQMSLLMPDGSAVGRNIGIGLGTTITSAELYRTLRLSNGAVLFSVLGTKAGGEKSLTHFISHNGELQVLDASQNPAVESFKGYVLDRYVTSLVPRGLDFKRRFHDDLLAGTATEPNLSSNAQFLHAKWGNLGIGTCDYFLKNYRLSAARSIPFVGIVASPHHLDDLRDVLQCVQEEIGGPRFTLISLRDFAPRYGVTSEEVDRVIGYIDGLAIAQDMAGLQAFVNSWAEPAEVSHETTGALDLTDDAVWTAHTQALLTRDAAELRGLLRSTLSRYTPYWETDYQLPLAAVASFLRENHPREEIRAAALELFPELSLHPKAYEQLRKLMLQGGRVTQESSGGNREDTSLLVPFSLKDYLGPAVIPMDSTSPGTARETGLYTHLITTIKDNPDDPITAVQMILADLPGISFTNQTERDNVLASLTASLYPMLLKHLGDAHLLIQRWKLDAVRISFDEVVQNLPGDDQAKLKACIQELELRTRTS